MKIEIKEYCPICIVCNDFSVVDEDYSGSYIEPVYHCNNCSWVSVGTDLLIESVAKLKLRKLKLKKINDKKYERNLR